AAVIPDDPSDIFFTSGTSGFDEEAGQFTGWTVRVLLDDWRPGDRRSPESGIESGLGAATDLQLFRSVA
ncbi:hypothetical protein P1N98_11595, partial [Tsukamurella tyrosinosolvens]|uniref:hypothetical protein n=1 Tax=Tsukamurella tyrosinosolvens TaxID=57704 RepID=UPI00248090E0